MTQTKLGAGARRSGSASEGDLSDEQLLERFNDRLEDSAEAAFAALIRRHGPMVFRVCDQILGDRHDAEDAFQASFLVLARKSGSIRHPELLGNWLYGVALRTAREAKMRDGRRRRFEAPAEVAAADAAGQPDQALMGREEMDTLHEEVARLPELYRIPLVLCELQGLTYGEVARRLGCPVGTIGVRLVRARARLRGQLIRRGIAPATVAVLLNCLFGEGTAAGLITIALIDATAAAAVRFVVGDAAATSLVPAAVILLTTAVLQSLKLATLKVTSSTLLLGSLAAALAVLGGGQLVRSPAATIPLDHPASINAPAGLIAVATFTPPPSPPLLASPPSVLPPAAEGPGAGSGSELVKRESGSAAPVRNLAGLGQPGREEVIRGEVLFAKEWVANDPASPHGDGLGPVFNATSCVACHGLGGPGGAGPETKNVILVSASSPSGEALPKTLGRIHPGFGTSRTIVVHRYGTDPSYGEWRRAFFARKHDKLKAIELDDHEETVEERIHRFAQQGKPNDRFTERQARLDGGPGVTLRVSERNSPALFGAGQIDSIATEILIDEAKAQSNGVRGRVSRMSDGRAGRFGWKGQIAGLHEFVRSACASELGLEVPGHSQAMTPLAPKDRARGLDLTESDCDALVAYVRALPAPVVVDPDGPHGNLAMSSGRQIFASVGCASCHTPSLGQIRGIYSDLLLHEMGQSLSDSGTYYGENTDSPGSASPGEWRTPPLWGFRDSGPYLHDGRAETLEVAVALHEGQAAASTRQFFALSTEDRSAVETFLKSLIAPSAASAPGIVLAADLEARVIPPEARQAELLTREQRKQAEAREVQARETARRRELAEVAARRAIRNFQLAANLERVGKFNGALRYYSEVVSDNPDSDEGRTATTRIAALASRVKAP